MAPGVGALLVLASCGGEELPGPGSGIIGYPSDAHEDAGCYVSAGYNGYSPAAAFDGACPEMGGLGQPCYSDGTCDPGFTCATDTVSGSSPTMPSHYTQRCASN
jgi:hypothetical protein